MSIQVLWDASMGVPTMNSACDGFSLAKNEFQVLQNWRVTSRGLKVRYPYVKQTTSGLSGAWRGSTVVNLNGKDYKFIALESAGVTNVYVSTGGTFSAVTASTGPNGDTTLLTPATAIPASHAGNVATWTNNHNLATGYMVGSAITQAGLTVGATYWFNRASATTGSFHTNLEDAIAGSNKVALSGSFTANVIPSLHNYVHFQVVRETATGDPGGGAFYQVSGRDLLLISDGTTVLTYDVAETGLKGKIAKHQQSWSPGPGPRIRQEFGWDQWLNMSAANVTETTIDAGRLPVNDDQAHPDTGGLTPYFSITTGITTNDWAKFAFGTGDTVVAGNQLHILYDCPQDRYIWDKVKVEVSNDDATYYTVYTPGSNKGPIITGGGTSDDMRGFKIASLNLDANVVPPATIVKYVRFTYTYATAPSAAVNFYFIGCMGGANIPGGTLFRLTYYNSGSRAESIGVTCQDRQGRNTGFMGCQDQRNYVDVLGNTLVSYAFYLTFQTPSTTERDKGLDYVLVYGRAPGTKTFQYVTSQTIASSNGSAWSYTTVNGVSQSASGDATKPLESVTYYSRRAPDGLNTCVPPFKCSAAVGGRLFVGQALSRNVDTADIANDAYFSEQDHPFRMRDVIAFSDATVPDPTSGGRIVIPGGVVKWMAPMVGDYVGVGSVLIWTDKELLSVQGIDAIQLSRTQSVMPFGTESPFSVRTWHNKVAWLDHTLQVRVYGPGVHEVPTRDRMDNITTAIPRHRWAWAMGDVSAETYRLAYTLASGAVNTVQILYSFLYDAWVRDAPLVTPSIQFGKFESWNGKLYSFTEDGAVYLCDDSASSNDTDGSNPAAIVPVATLREFHRQGQYQLQFKRLGILCDGASSKSYEAWWTDKDGVIATADGSTTPTISVSSSNHVWRWNVAGAGFERATAYPTFKAVTASGMPAAKQVYAFVGEFEEVKGDKLGAPGG